MSAVLSLYNWTNKGVVKMNKWSYIECYAWWNSNIKPIDCNDFLMNLEVAMYYYIVWHVKLTQISGLKNL
jgi:hypothetical protein